MQTIECNKTDRLSDREIEDFSETFQMEIVDEILTVNNLLDQIKVHQQSQQGHPVLNNFQKHVMARVMKKYA